MNKIVRIGTTIIGRKPVSVYCNIRIENRDGKQRLSITGVEGPLPSGNAYGGGCQLPAYIDDPANYIHTWAPGWNYKLFKKFLGIWDEWHLNDMRAGCVHQREHGRTPEYDPCPICNYAYGSAWLYEPLPQNVIDFLVSLPDTDIQPAWV